MLRKKNVIGAVIFLLISIAALHEGYRLSPGTASSPRAGFLPLYLGLALAFLSVTLFVKAAILECTQTEDSIRFEGRWGGILSTLTVLVIYALVLQTVGFLICSFLALLILFRCVEGRSWKSTLTISLFCTAISYILFAKFLGVPVPRGVIPY